MIQADVVPQAPQAPLPDVIIGGGGAPPWETLPPQVFLLVVMAVMGGAVLILAPLAKAFARRIEGGPAGRTRGELADLRARLDALEQRALTSGEPEVTDHRMYELEERVEFVERLLAEGGARRDAAR